ncbi:MAG: lamin tail domain-containing protein, partial [Chthoniobacterales bacterium]
QEIIPTTSSRIGMASGAATYLTLANRTVSDASVETYVLPATALLTGDNVLAVEVHQSNLQSGGGPSSDIVWGMKLDVSTVVAGEQPVVLNEVLARNVTQTNPDGSRAGWIELYNPSSSTADLSNMSLTNNVSDPRRYVFPANTSLPANSYLVVQCDALASSSPTNTGFALSGAGGGVYLFDAPAIGGGLRDSVAYGHQLPDFAVGRVANGSGAFTLTVPSRGQLNSAAGLAALTGVKVNEWLAAPTSPPGWFELYNSSVQPVPLGGNYLTDQLGNRTRFLIPPLTFIGATAADRWLQWLADNDGGATPGHVNFSLNSAGEAIGLFTAAGTQIDAVTFTAQAAGVSQGRYPDGSPTIVALLATPAAANQTPPADADSDGLPDAWETAHGFDPNDSADAALDFDGDGFSNLAEYLSGTDPRDSSSLLSAVLLPGAAPGQIVVRFKVVAGKSYSVCYKDNLHDAVWLKLADVSTVAADGWQDVTDISAAGHVMRFYQVVTPQQP